MACARLVLLPLMSLAIASSDVSQTSLEEPGCGVAQRALTGSSEAECRLATGAARAGAGDGSETALGLLQTRATNVKIARHGVNVSTNGTSNVTSNGTFGQTTKCCENGVACVEATAYFDFTTLATACIAVTLGGYNPITSSLEECTCSSKGYTMPSSPEQTAAAMQEQMTPSMITSLPESMQSVVNSASSSLSSLVNTAIGTIMNLVGSDITFYQKGALTNAAGSIAGAAESGIGNITSGIMGGISGIFR